MDQRNWRAISLLNIDYKVCARALVGRLLKVLHHVVSPDQTYDIPGYFIDENVALLKHVVELANEITFPWPYYHWIKKRLLLAWIGLFFFPHSLVWGFGLLFFDGLNCFTH